MNVETLSAPLEIKMTPGGDAGRFEGYGAFFGNVDSHSDMIVPGAFAATLAERAASGRGHVSMHYNHGLPNLGGERSIGVWERMAEDSKGLHVAGRVSGMNTDKGRHLFERVKDGAIKGLSIGYILRPNGAIYSKAPNEPRRTLKGIALQEVSLVDEPSNAAARITAVKSLASARELEDLLRENGLAKAAARKIAAAGWPALAREPTPAPERPAFDFGDAGPEMKAFLDLHLTKIKGLF